MVSVTATVAGSVWFLLFRMVMRAEPSGRISMSLHVRAAASERLRPPSAITPMIARSIAPRACAMVADSMRPPRPRPGKAGGLPDPCQGQGSEGVHLCGLWSLIPPALDGFGHDRMAGGIVALGDPLRGMGVGDCGPGLIYGGQRLPVPAARWPR